jgi:hypothetical protein
MNSLIFFPVSITQPRDTTGKITGDYSGGNEASFLERNRAFIFYFGFTLAVIVLFALLACISYAVSKVGPHWFLCFISDQSSNDPHHLFTLPQPQWTLAKANEIVEKGKDAFVYIRSKFQRQKVAKTKPSSSGNSSGDYFIVDQDSVNEERDDKDASGDDCPPNV